MQRTEKSLGHQEDGGKDTSNKGPKARLEGERHRAWLVQGGMLPGQGRGQIEPAPGV